MIVRRVGDTHHIIRQTAHARQTGVIAAHLRAEFLPPHNLLRDFLLAAAKHDDGWIAWEAAPRFGTDGLPLNFSDIDKGRHLENWYRGIFSILHEVGPFAASLLARHALPLVKEKGEDVVACFNDLLGALEKRAWPDLDPGEACRRTTHHAAALSFADLVSLVPCAGWSEPQQIDLYDSEGAPVSVTITLESPWAVRVDPWPFEVPALPSIPVEARTISVGMERDAAAMLTAYSIPATILTMDILPVGGTS